MNHFFLLLLSSLIFSLSFIFPDKMGFLVFFYLIPIFYLALREKLTLAKGFFWGVIFYSIHFYYFFILINENAQGQFKQIAFIFIVLYFSLYAGLWFFVTNWVAKNKKLQAKIIIWVVFTLLYIYFCYNFIFWIFQRNEGYVLTHPLLPLTNLFLINIISKIGIWLLALFLILFSMFIALFFLNKNKIYILTSLGFLFPFLSGYFINPEIEKNIDFKLGIISINSKSNSPYDIAVEIKSKILQLITKNPNLNVILLPETAFPFALNEFDEVINWWFCGLKNKNIHIFIGSHRKQHNTLFNTVYHLFDCRIINYYDKTNLMFFTEKIPQIWKSIPISEIFLKDSKEFCTGKDQNKIFKIGKFIIEPFICSDLFLNKENNKNCDFIFFFMNSSWFSCDYIKNLMNLFIKFKELILNKKIIIVSNDRQKY